MTNAAAAVVLTGSASDEVRQLDRSVKGQVIDELRDLESAGWPEIQFAIEGKLYTARALPSGYVAVYRELTPQERHGDQREIAIIDLLPPQPVS